MKFSFIQNVFKVIQTLVFNQGTKSVNPVRLVGLPYVMWSAYFFVKHIQTEKISSWNTYCFLSILTLSPHSQTHIHIAVCQYSLYHLTHKSIYILLSVITHFITSLTLPYTYSCLSILTLSPHSQTHIHIAVCQYPLYHLTHKPIYILLSVNTHFITSLTDPYIYCCLSILTLSPHSQNSYTYCCLSILTLSPHSQNNIHIAVCQYSLYHLTHKPIYILLSVNTHFITSLTDPYTYCCLSILT